MNVKKYWWVLLVIIIVVPIVINILYTTNLTFFSSVFFDNNTWLSFWGSFLGGTFGGFATLIAVVITINHNEKKYQEQLTQSILPFMHSEISDVTIMYDQIPDVVNPPSRIILVMPKMLNGKKDIVPVGILYRKKDLLKNEEGVF